MSWKETDPLAVWKNSTIIPIGPEEAKKFENAAPIAIKSDRSRIWQGISDLRSSDQRTYMETLINNWPYAKERRAFQFPLYVSSFTNSLVALYVSNRIVAVGSYNYLNGSFREIFNRSPKMPFVFAFYTGCLTSLGFWHWSVRRSLIDEEKPCASCVLAKAYGTMVISGIGMPVLTTPWLVHFMNDQESVRNVRPSNLLELFILNYKYVKPIWKELPKVLAVQFIVATACVYSAFWARDRIFDSFEVDQDTIRSAINAVPEDTWQTRLTDALKNIDVRGTSKDTSILKSRSSPDISSIRKQLQSTNDANKQ
ncbi:hypothetical protein M3Y97_00130500 [Aphelenchoides bicaudatus]|nr:hypothetical protein M3Y97_00130500 [Aphelenchoides bicaudatus]